MEVLAPPSDEKLLLTLSWLWNTLLVVIAPTEIVEQSGGQLPHHCWEGAHTAHSSEAEADSLNV